MKKRKLKNKWVRDTERANKLEARKRKSRKCQEDCYLLNGRYYTHNGCITCMACKNSPFKTKRDKYLYFRNKRTRRESWNEYRLYL